MLSTTEKVRPRSDGEPDSQAHGEAYDKDELEHTAFHAALCSRTCFAVSTVSLLDQVIGLNEVQTAGLISLEAIVWQLVSARNTSVIPTSPIPGLISIRNDIENLLGCGGVGRSLTRILRLCLTPYVSELA